MPAPDEMAIYFDERQPPFICTSLEEADAELDKLHRAADPTKRPLAIAIKVFGHEIDMALGADLTFLCLQIEPCDGEYYLAVGEEIEGEEQAFYGSYESYWEPRYLIPIEAARFAARVFIGDQSRRSILRWEDWNGHDVQ